MKWRAHGFTLLELMLAMVIGAMMVLIAHRSFAAVTEGWQRLEQHRLGHDRTVNAHRWLESAFLSLEVDRVHGSFDGQRERVGFDSWLESPDGWFERVRLAIARDNDRLVATGVPWGSVELSAEVDSIAFDYLLALGATSGWVREWHSPVSAPLAVRMRVHRARASRRIDTLLFLIKERG